LIVAICLDDDSILDHRDEKKLVDIENKKNTLFQTASKHNNISVVDTPIGRILFFDYSYQGGLINYGSFKGGIPYTRYYHLSAVLNDEIKNILVLGVGSGTVINDCYHLYNINTLDAVDIDPEVVAIAQKFFNLSSDNYLKVHITDAREFVFSAKHKYDLIIMDVFLAYGMPLNLMTAEFIQKAFDCLTNDGIMGVNYFSTEKIAGNKSLVFRAQYKTYKEVFPNVYVFPVLYGAYEFYRYACNLRYKLGTLTNTVILASKNNKHITKPEFIRKAQVLQSNTNFSYLKNYALYARDYYNKEIPTEDVRILKDSILDDKELMLEKLMDYIKN
jgi:spermidine synthase